LQIKYKNFKIIIFFNIIPTQKESQKYCRPFSRNASYVSNWLKPKLC